MGWGGAEGWGWGWGRGGALGPWAFLNIHLAAKTIYNLTYDLQTFLCRPNCSPKLTSRYRITLNKTSVDQP